MMATEWTTAICRALADADTHGELGQAVYEALDLLRALAGRLAYSPHAADPAACRRTAVIAAEAQEHLAAGGVQLMFPFAHGEHDAVHEIACALLRVADQLARTLATPPEHSSAWPLARQAAGQARHCVRHAS